MAEQYITEFGKGEDSPYTMYRVDEHGNKHPSHCTIDTGDGIYPILVWTGDRYYWNTLMEYDSYSEAVDHINLMCAVFNSTRCNNML